MNHSRLIALFLLLSVSPLPALAQDMEDMDANRIDRLERDIMLLQRQLARGGDSSSSDPEATGLVANPAQVEVRLSNMEEELRTLRGRVEEAEFQSRKTAESLEKFQRDVEFRFNEQKPAADVPPSDATLKDTVKPQTSSVDKVEPKTESVISVATKTEVPPEPTTGGDGVLRAPDSPAEAEHVDEFATPRDHYNHAFRLLNQTKYEDAAAAFSSFIKKYSKDPLVGNAYYWQGETYYIRRDYVNAADSFRQGFESLPDGPKAADNLLKLAMSLDALDRDKEACVVLKQIVTKYKKSSTNITSKADQERKRIGCDA